MAETIAGRLRDLDLIFHGTRGIVVEIPSANPANYYEAIRGSGTAERLTIDAKLFLPAAGDGAVAIIVPGSLGVGPNHLDHAETLVGEGIGVLVLDPFSARSVSSTVANQVQYSFAASAFDVLAALRFLCERGDVDATRISAQGHSRGGSAVTIAAMRRFADPILGPDTAFAGVYAVYPWCGHQFLDPRVGRTVYRAIIGELDEWVSVQEAQAQTHAIQLTGAEASVRVVPNAHHSFDRLEDVSTIDDAAVAPTAPTVHLANDGAMINPRTGESDSDWCDYDAFVASMKGGHGRRGAALGGREGEPELFRADMLAFHRKVLGVSP